MKEILSINLGQCGIQVADCFWKNFAADLQALSVNQMPSLEEAQSFFVVPGGARTPEGGDMGNLGDFVSRLKSRCILVDTEVGTVNEVLQKQHLNLIDETNIVCGTEATGNNWTTAYYDLGPHYQSAIEELITKNLEIADQSFQYFNITFALAGGTGSGLGSYVLGLLSDEYAKIQRICNVVTQESAAAVSPYNSLLCLKHLNEKSTIVNMFSNEALLQQSVQSTALILRDKQNNSSSDGAGFFTEVNELISRHLKEFGRATVSRAYPGFNMISVVNTLTPLPGLNLMCPAMTPSRLHTEGAGTEVLLNELLKHTNRISPLPSKEKGRPMAMAIHGNFDCGSFKYLKRLKLKNGMVGWMRDATKVSLTEAFSADNMATKPTGMHAIVNDCAIASFLERTAKNFDRLYSKKAFLHHFSRSFDTEEFVFARERVEQLRTDYDTIAKSMMPPQRFLDGAPLVSLGTQSGKQAADPYPDIWTNDPSTIENSKRCWRDLCGSPIV